MSPVHDGKQILNKPETFIVISFQRNNRMLGFTHILLRGGKGIKLHRYLLKLISLGFTPLEEPSKSGKMASKKHSKPTILHLPLTIIQPLTQPQHRILAMMNR